ncbi:hypothetical protein [Calycomorphotria hydatis]|nr:hypothetical protein [Calycomorphotria hydatis]
MRHDITAFLIMLTVAAVGCGGNPDGPQRYSLSGSVTYNGQPVPAGNILLSPNREKGNSGPATVASINDGKYETFPGKGMVGGHFVVTITAEPKQEMTLPLFDTYTMEVELPNEDSSFDFDVPAQE